jgi:hypothetical protein
MMSRCPTFADVRCTRSGNDVRRWMLDCGCRPLGLIARFETRRSQRFTKRSQRGSLDQSVRRSVVLLRVTLARPRKQLRESLVVLRVLCVSTRRSGSRSRGCNDHRSGQPAMERRTVNCLLLTIDFRPSALPFCLRFMRARFIVPQFLDRYF